MKQTMFVRTKGQLLAAVGCAIDFKGVTEITLQRKRGVTLYSFGYSNFPDYMSRFNQGVRRVCNQIRKMKAICFE